MERAEIITELKYKFDIRELVCQHTYNKFGDLSWQFLDTELLHTLLVLRNDIFKASMNINYGSYTQRGLRCNICQLVKDKTSKNEIYLSAHCNGAAFDCDVKGLTAEQARQKIKDNQHLLPYNIRIEAAVAWLHFDCYDTGVKVFEFNA